MLTMLVYRLHIYIWHSFPMYHVGSRYVTYILHILTIMDIVYRPWGEVQFVKRYVFKSECRYNEYCCIKSPCTLAYVYCLSYYWSTQSYFFFRHIFLQLSRSESKNTECSEPFTTVSLKLDQSPTQYSLNRDWSICHWKVPTSPTGVLWCRKFKWKPKLQSFFF